MRAYSLAWLCSYEGMDKLLCLFFRGSFVYIQLGGLFSLPFLFSFLLFTSVALHTTFCMFSFFVYFLHLHFFVHFWALSGGWEREPCKLARTSQSREVTIEVRSRFCTYRVKITITPRISSGGAGAGFVLDIVCTCDEAASSRMCLYPVCRVWIPPRVIHPR